MTLSHPLSHPRRSPFLFACTLALVAACGDDDDTSAVDAGPDAALADLGGSDLGGSDLGGGDLGSGDLGSGDLGSGDLGSDMGAASCGSERPAIGGVRGTEGLVIARDGTLYYSQSGGVGRLTPDGTNDARWLSIAGTSTIWGLGLDAANERLFVASPADATVYSVVIATRTVTPLSEVVRQPNGLTVGPDGAVYIGDFSDSVVYRIDTATGDTTTVTTSTVPSANGLAFDPADDSTLYVLSYSGGTLLALTLDATHSETARRTVASALGNPDGITIDDAGRFYITDNSGGRVLLVSADGSTTTTISTSRIGAAANLAFGVGALDCHDLYVTSSGALARLAVPDAIAGVVPWQ